MSAPLSMPDAVAPFQLAPASRYSIEQLTAAYNQTRVDYLVPMPMNAARLADYIRTYDVDLAHSFVAAAGQMLGLGLLGVRPDCTWITRLGVLPVQRRHGVGRAIVEALLEASETVGGERTVLEVIKNNVPAYNLFWDSGFREARELLVLRRPPGPPAAVTVGEARWLDRAEALALAEQRRAPESWITDAQSLAHVEQLMGVRLTLPDGSRGWIVFEHQRHGKYIVVLSRFALSTEQGNPITLGKALLAHVYQRFPDLDTHIENIAASDPHLPALYAMGYVESFRRIEMQRLNGVGGRRADPAA